MSFFQENVDIYISAIAYFNKLEQDRKIYLITNLAKPGAYTEEELKYLRPFLLAIQNDITKYTSTKVAQRIFDLGMDKDYAQLFIKNIIDKAPTIEYHASIINQINDESFKEKFPKVINSVYLHAKSNEEIANEEGLTVEQVQAITGLFINALHPFLRVEIAEHHVKIKSKELKMAESKIETLLNTLKINQEYFKNQIIFLNSGDLKNDTASIRQELELLKQQNELILKVLRQLLEGIKGNQSSTPDHIR